MRKKLLTILAAMCFIFIGSNFAFAYMSYGRHCNNQPCYFNGANRMPMFFSADADKDGKVSKDEFTKFHQDFFKKADVNKDKSLTKDEFINAQKDRRIEGRFLRLDTNKDGQISKDEFEAGRAYRNKNRNKNFRGRQK